MGEPEQNGAWALLEQTRRWLFERGKTPENAPGAFAAVDAAEGGGWFRVVRR